MKRIMFLVIFASLQSVFLSGCSGEFWKHDTMWKNYSHMKFSLYGYKHPTLEVVRKSVKEGWWGEPVDVDFTEADLKE